MRTFVLLLLLGVAAKASPFLISDSYPAGLSQFLMPVTFIVKGLSANPISSQAQINADGTVMLHYDLQALSNGSYTVIVDAVNALGGVSPDSAPFTFQVGVPSTPTNIRIVP